MASASISQLEVNGTTYDICDATVRDSLSQYLLKAGDVATGSLQVQVGDVDKSQADNGITETAERSHGFLDTNNTWLGRVVCRAFTNGDIYTSNYHINYVYGTIEVTKRNITIQPKDCMVTYNAEAFDYNNSGLKEIILVDSTLGSGIININCDCYDLICINAGEYDLSETFTSTEISNWNGDTFIENGLARNFIVQNDAWKGIDILQYITIADVTHTGTSATIDEDAIIGYNIDTGELVIRFRNTDTPSGSDGHYINTITVHVEFEIDAQYHIWKKVGGGNWTVTDWSLSISGNQVTIEDDDEITENTQIRIIDTQSNWELLHLKGIKTFYLNILKYRN